MSFYVTSLEELTVSMDTYGFAIWRNLVPPKVQAQVYDIVDHSIPGTNGTVEVSADIVNNILVTKELEVAFKHLLGDHELLVRRHRSVILLARYGTRSTVWHQEIETVPGDHLTAWVNLTNGAGVDCPGLGFIVKKFNERIPEFVRDNDNLEASEKTARDNIEWPVVYPEFGAGDVIFFNSYTIHRSHVTAEMSNKRIAYKLTVRPI